MACRPTSWNAIFCAECFAAAAIIIAEKTLFGNFVLHSSTCIPPIDPPMTARRDGIFNFSMSIFCALTISAIVMIGNSRLYGFCVFGFTDRGPVVPAHDPRVFGHIIKYLSVLIGFPGPTIFSHHPFFFVMGFFSAQNWSPVRAWHMRIAFDFF